MPTLRDVKRFWEDHPLLSYELGHAPGTREFFKAYNAIRAEVEKFCLPILGLDRCAGKKVLDVGCGNGWLLWNFARNGGLVTGMDLTETGVDISRKRFTLENLKGDFICANAEQIPFQTDSFDIVTSLGVIHHTPRTEQCAHELVRVTKPGGRLTVCIYYRNFFLRKQVFPLLQLTMRLFGMHRSTEDPQGITDRIKISPEEFVKSYDGPDNPLGKFYSKAEALRMFDGLGDIRTEVHYFPRRFVPGLRRFPMPRGIEFLLDRYMGIMLYISGRKKEKKS